MQQPHFMSNCAKMFKSQRQWSDLPSELVSDIADRLGIIELLSFRTICKAWNSASSTASAKIESTRDFEPWFLLYGMNGDDDHKDPDYQCQLLVAKSGQKYTVDLPELDGTTCLASNQGWLLLFQQGGSMFFFHPFSRTKIDLPKFPVLELSDHVAAFSSPPTSQDCTVCVVSRRSGDELELNVLHRGASEWIQHKYDRPIDTIKCAAYVKEEFYFFDNRDELITLCTKDLSWRRHIVVSCKSKELKSPDQFFCRRDYFQSKDIRKKLGLAADASISICGTKDLNFKIQLHKKLSCIFSTLFVINQRSRVEPNMPLQMPTSSATVPSAISSQMYQLSPPFAKSHTFNVKLSSPRSLSDQNNSIAL